MALSLLPAATLAAKPERETDSYTDRFHGDFILDMCGIDTWTTVTERWTLKTLARWIPDLPHPAHLCPG